MNAAQLLSTPTLMALSQAMDRYFDSDAGTWPEEQDLFFTAAGQAYVVKAAADESGIPATILGVDNIPSDSPHDERDNGYDFAFVDNRWIVDLWAKSYLGSTKILYDMSDPADAALAEKTFGPRSTWQPLRISYTWMNAAVAVWNEFKTPYDVVDKLMGEQ